MFMRYSAACIDIDIVITYKPKISHLHILNFHLRTYITDLIGMPTKSEYSGSDLIAKKPQFIFTIRSN